MARLIPVAVTLEITGRCNFACRHCVVPDHEVSDGLTTARVLALLDELARHRWDREPTNWSQ